jgi:hypothetical protein
MLDIPLGLLITTSNGNPLASLRAFSNLLDNIHDMSFSQNRAILAYKNVIVDLINDYLLDLFHDGSKPAPICILRDYCSE